jgi:GT2 family glycosyltransferase
MGAKATVDIIILSFSKNDHLKALTIQAISSLTASEDPENIHFNVLVIESNKALKPYQFPDSTTIYPEEKFGFHKFFNIGIRLTSSPYVCLCNNDLLFHKNWASEIIQAMDKDQEMLCAVPYCPVFHKKHGFKENTDPFSGYFGVLTGWCLFVKREIFEIIGPLDEKFIFWYCDYDFGNTLEKMKIKGCLISSSFVTHLGSESLNAINEKEYKRLTREPHIYFKYKWHHHSFIRYVLEMGILRVRALLHF